MVGLPRLHEQGTAAGVPCSRNFWAATIKGVLAETSRYFWRSHSSEVEKILGSISNIVEVYGCKDRHKYCLRPEWTAASHCEDLTIFCRGQFSELGSVFIRIKQNLVSHFSLHVLLKVFFSHLSTCISLHKGQFFLLVQKFLKSIVWMRWGSNYLLQKGQQHWCCGPLYSVPLSHVALSVGCRCVWVPCMMWNSG